MADINIDEEERRLISATIIQHHWREYLQRKKASQGLGGDSPDGTPGASGAIGGASSGDALVGEDGERKEQSEEEVRESLLSRARSLIAEREVSIQQNLTLQRHLARLFEEKQQQQKQRGGAGGGSGLPGEDGNNAGSPNGASSEAAEAKYWDQVAKVRSDRLGLDRMRNAESVNMEMDRQAHEEVAVRLMDAERIYRDVVREHTMKLAEASLPLSVTRAPSTLASKQARAKVMNAVTKKLDEFEAIEDAEYARLHDSRVAFIQSKNRCRNLERRIKMKDNLDDDVQMIDFEQLKIENTNLNEKIEERNEDLLKLKKKATTTIHILTHVKEKLEFVKGQNATLLREVESQESSLTNVRDALNGAKKEREFFATENTRMKEKMPLIGANNLLLDYELRKKSIENLQLEVVSLTNEHHELMIWIRANHPATLAKQQYNNNNSSSQHNQSNNSVRSRVV